MNPATHIVTWVIASLILAIGIMGFVWIVILAIRDRRKIRRTSGGYLPEADEPGGRGESRLADGHHGGFTGGHGGYSDGGGSGGDFGGGGGHH